MKTISPVSPWSLWLQVLFFLTSVAEVFAQTDKPEADPAVWGAYAKLVGHRYLPPDGKFPGYEVIWTKPGLEMQEAAVWEGDKLGGIRLIRPGTQPGQLIAEHPQMSWVGTVQADGSVLFVRDGIFKFPYRVAMIDDKSWVMQSVKLKDGAVAHATETHVYVISDQTPTQMAATDNRSVPVSVPSAPALQKQTLASDANTVAAPVEQAAAADAPPNWGVLEKTVGKTWQLENSGGWMAHRNLITYTWTPDERGIEMSEGDGYSSKLTGNYKPDPSSPGRLIADTFDEDGKPVKAVVTVDASGAVTAQLSEKRRSITSLDANGALIQTRQKLSWGGEWKTMETLRFIDADPGPAWGVFAQLAGYNWVVNSNNNLNFVWLPQQGVIQARMGRDFGDITVVNFALRPEHERQLVARSSFTGERDYYFGEPVGLVVVDGETKAQHYFGENRFTYELVAPDRLLVHSEKWVEGELRKFDQTYIREDRAQKDKRVADIKSYQEARAASERSTRFLQAMEQMNGVLTAANQVASARAAQSQANLDATLATMSAQVERERLEAASRAAREKMDRERKATAQVRPVASAVTEAEPERAAKPKQAGTHKILPNQYVLNTATNSVAPTANATPAANSGPVAGAGKVRLCARPGDETHYDPCPKENPQERRGEAGQTGGSGGGAGGVAGDASRNGKVGGGGSTVPSGGYAPGGKPGSDPIKSGGNKQGDGSDRPQAKAWCTKNKRGEFMCMGPLQKLLSFYPSLEVALDLVGCANGFGYTPVVGSGSSFDCGRKLTSGEKEMPLYDPY